MTTKMLSAAKPTATERVFKLVQFTTAKKSNKENESLAQQ